MFGEKTLGKSLMYIGIKVMPRLFRPSFVIFTIFNTTPLILLTRIILSNSGGLMLVCRWAGVDALVKNKFRSTIHLLRQHLLAPSRQWKHHTNVLNLLEVNNKDTRLMSLTSFWCPFC